MFYVFHRADDPLSIRTVCNNGFYFFHDNCKHCDRSSCETTLRFSIRFLELRVVVKNFVTENKTKRSDCHI